MSITKIMSCGLDKLQQEMLDEGLIQEIVPSSEQIFINLRDRIKELKSRCDKRMAHKR